MPELESLNFMMFTVSEAYIYDITSDLLVTRSFVDSFLHIHTLTVVCNDDTDL